MEIEINAGVDAQMSRCYANVLERMKQALVAGTSTARKALGTITAQLNFVNTITKVATTTAEKHSSRAKRLEYLKTQLANTPELKDLNCLALPLDPSIQVTGIQRKFHMGGFLNRERFQQMWNYIQQNRFKMRDC